MKPLWLIVVAALISTLATEAAQGGAADRRLDIYWIDVEGGAARITLSTRAEQRLGLRTAPVVAAGAALVVPYAAVVYGATGQAFAFARVAERTYARTPLDVAAVSGEQATLSTGPAAGTEVVVVAVAELVGVESGISGEQ